MCDVHVGAAAPPRAVTKTLGPQVALTMNTYGHVLPEVGRSAVQEAARRLVLYVWPDPDGGNLALAKRSLRSIPRRQLTG